MTPAIQIRHLSKVFSSSMPALQDLSLEIHQGEFFALLGPSGCGKTTLLRIIAGLETPGEGELLIDGQDMSRVPVHRRPVHIVFQSYALFPHMSVLENVAYSLKIARVDPQERIRLAQEALAMVELADLDHRAPDQLSGGQQQRVALARALVKRPKILLLDEPLSALDAKLRDNMRRELVRLHQKIGITFVLVTHDQEEALSVADRIAVMHKGQIEQLATPVALYESPRNRFVANFIGEVNLIEGTVQKTQGDVVFLESSLGVLRVGTPKHLTPGSNVVLALRPEKISLHSRSGKAERGTNQVAGATRERSYLGGSSLYHVEVAGVCLKVACANAQRFPPAPQEEILLSWRPEDMVVLEA